jgi:hypothetical protein
MNHYAHGSQGDGHHWTSAEDVELQALSATCAPVAVMARTLRRPINAVRARLEKLGITQ